ncbi:hypothetical protein NOCA2300017 [metagenome]|uniref:HTH luxR-type domain-containing protein n=1 Tax=metagenome TaxID=256318 RepID=A0A2P2C197_9ZZZZ
MVLQVVTPGPVPAADNAEIEQAKGMLMERLGVSASAAGALLRRRSSELGVGVDELADRVLGGETQVEMARTRSWRGREAGLTEREAQVMELITAGLGNREIAGLLYLSLNSVKSYIPSAYRKIGVDTRAKAVLWGAQNGFLTDRSE